MAAVAITVSIVMVACSGAPEKTNGSRNDTLIIAENEQPATFDPVQADNSTVDEVVIPAYDTLITFNEDSKLVGELATEWKLVDGGRSIQFTLRDGPTFHDGSRVTSADVKYTLDRIKDINVGVASQLTAYDTTDVDDPTHFTIRLTAANVPFLGALSRVYILNSKLVEANAGADNGQKWLATHDAGSGPYQLKSYTPNQQAKFTQYKDYWGGFDGQAKQVIFKYMATSTERSSLQNGDVDIAMDVAPNDWGTFESNEKFTVDKANTNVMLYVFFKMKNGLTSNKYLREAISYAYDYEQHKSAILKDAGQLAKGVMPEGMQCYTGSTPQPTFDLAKAKSLMAKSGLGGVKLRLTYLKATAEMEQSAAVLQSALMKIGVTLELQAITYPQFVDEAKTNATTPDMGMIYAFPTSPDPDSILYQNFNSAFINAGQNWGGFRNSAVDELTEKAQSVTDEEKRCGIYGEVEKLIAAETPTINLSNPQYVTVFSKRLTGYKYDASHQSTVDVYRIKVS